MIRHAIDVVFVLALTVWWRLVQLLTGRDGAPES